MPISNQAPASLRCTGFSLFLRIVVIKIIALTGIDPLLILETTKVTTTVQELLKLHLNICYLLTSTIKKYATIIQQEIPDTRMDLVDLLRIYPVTNAQQFIEIIKILTLNR